MNENNDKKSKIQPEIRLSCPYKENCPYCKSPDKKQPLATEK